MVSDGVVLNLEQGKTHLCLQQFRNQISFCEDTGLLMLFQFNLGKAKVILQFSKATGLYVFEGHTSVPCPERKSVLGILFNQRQKTNEHEQVIHTQKDCEEKQPHY